MKKTYVKPEIMLVRFELSEAIASCGTKWYQNHSQETSCVLNPAFDGITFTVTSDKQCDIPLKDYCYFTSNGNKLMNS